MKFQEYLVEAKIPSFIIDELSVTRPHWRSIKRDLSLPIIPKGKYIGSMKAHQCQTNAPKHKRERKKWGESCDVYDGYLIWKDEDGWQAVDHWFNVVDGKVHELTNLSDTWDKNTYYIGKKKK